MKLKPTTICPVCNQTIDTSVVGAMARHMRWQHKGTKVKTETRIKQSPLATPDEIADALLRKVMLWLSEKDTYTELASDRRDLKNKVLKLTEENRSLRDERDRLLKIHNEYRTRNKDISTQDLINLAKK